jgi:hypothetical protein
VVEITEFQTAAAPMETIRTFDSTSWSPEYPVVVLSSDLEALVTDADRDYMWKRFGLPVFEYLLDGNGEILARECEAHDGLHLDRTFESFGRLRITEEPCACGQPGARLMPLAAAEGSNAII